MGRFHGQAAYQQGERLKGYEYEPKPLAPYDVEVAITHCGICHSDLHMIDGDWGISAYPLLPGHEIIGEVVDRGNLASLEVGARVGVGWQRSACLSCPTCLTARENACPEAEATIVGHHGGFADRIRTAGRFAFPIPDALTSETADPTESRPVPS